MTLPEEREGLSKKIDEQVQNQQHESHELRPSATIAEEISID